ncbi:MAG: 4Fe-4S dicluster domain-containing protein [Coriobacteriales bacterium]|jgi:carbon-monoxide dehydrogenase iron sulfur subunit|nr:4Fe-4S dicluster domain-containing protein [Coriobacteriales bacterium]
MMRILIDDEKCLACHSCEIACCVAHSKAKALYGAVFEAKLPHSRMHVESGGKGRGFPLSCRHCQDPQCVRACVTKALTLGSDGVVQYNEQKCIGCLMCFITCPFGVIEEDIYGDKPADYSISKCDLCVSLKRDPACVEACPTKALILCDPDSFSRSRRVKYLVELVDSTDL